MENQVPPTMCATLAVPHVPGTDLIFCAPLALAWQALERRFGRLRFDPQPPLAEALSSMAVEQIVDPSWCVVGAGRGAEGILEQLRSELSSKFPDADPRLLPYSLAPDALLAFGYLGRDLSFSKPFAERRVWFRQKPVRAFGTSDARDEDNQARAAQVVVHEYTSDREFVIELCAAGADDRILIAQIPPREELSATVRDAMDRLGRLPAPYSALQRDETLLVPRIRLEEDRRFPEVIGRPLLTEGLKGVHFDEVKQHVAFTLNEAGASVAAYAVMASFGVPERKRDFVVAEPFLLMLIRREAAIPYLALWVETQAWMQPEDVPEPPDLGALGVLPPLLDRT
jgi:hypothetical protein